MIVIGIDPHMKTHTAVALDAATGRQVGETTVTADVRGSQRLLSWARGLDAERTFAIEDCRHVSGRLERFLLPHDEKVCRVPPKMMANARAASRTTGKSDPIDAAAVARAALATPDLPSAELAGAERDIRLLADHRDDLVAERTRIQARLRWHLHDLELPFDVPRRALDRAVWLDRLEAHLATLAPTTQARIAADLVARCRRLTREITAAEREIAGLVEAVSPDLLALPGCGAVTAAHILGETGSAKRFATDAAFAMHAGVAPLPVSSGQTNRHRLSPSGTDA